MKLSHLSSMRILSSKETWWIIFCFIHLFTKIFAYVFFFHKKGRVYIGAVNKLYQLSHDLGLTANAITGPKEDSPLCSVLPDCPANVEKKLTNNVNKALVIDYAESRIIECGSLFQVHTDNLPIYLFLLCFLFYIINRNLFFKDKICATIIT